MTSNESEPRPALVPLSTLRPAPWNPRRIDKRRFANLCESIKADPSFMWNRPVLAQADGTVYAGNMRLRACEHLGWTELPAILEDVSETRAKERALRDNNGWGEWVEEQLAEMVYDLGQSGSPVELLGFDERTLERFIGRERDDQVHYSTRFEVVVECQDEAQQEQLFNRLQAEGLSCRVLTL